MNATIKRMSQLIESLHRHVMAYEIKFMRWRILFPNILESSQTPTRSHRSQSVNKSYIMWYYCMLLPDHTIGIHIQHQGFQDPSYIYVGSMRHPFCTIGNFEGIDKHET